MKKILFVKLRPCEPKRILVLGCFVTQGFRILLLKVCC